MGQRVNSRIENVIWLHKAFAWRPSCAYRERALQGERCRLPRHTCISPISVAGFMHPTNQRTSRDSSVVRAMRELVHHLTYLSLGLFFNLT